MNKIKDQTFEDEEVVLDFNSYRDCIFEECILIYHGYGDTDLGDSDVQNCSWKFNGPAKRLLNLLASLMREGNRELVTVIVQSVFGEQAPLQVSMVDGDPHMIFDMGTVEASAKENVDEDAFPIAVEPGYDQSSEQPNASAE
jgi:hypothetical protein